jgi:hypothetical protein
LDNKDYVTLEEMFYNESNLQPRTVASFIQRTSSNMPGTLDYQVKFVMTVYEGWKAGMFVVEGDDVSLREWSQN